MQRVCQELGIQDWSQLDKAQVTEEDARIIQKAVGWEAEQISSEQFKQGLEVELEHGTQFTDANVTNNHPLLTGMIVLAHLKEMLDYYTRLEVAELEGDLLKAYRTGDAEKLLQKYSSLLTAKKILSNEESE